MGLLPLCTGIGRHVVVGGRNCVGRLVLLPNGADTLEPVQLANGTRKKTWLPMRSICTVTLPVTHGAAAMPNVVLIVVVS